MKQEKQQLAREQWVQVYAEATAGWAARIAAGKVGRGQQSAADFAAGFEVLLGPPTTTEPEARQLAFRA